MRRSANRARVVGGGRVLGMRVGGLYRPHHTHQGNAEHTHNSDEYAPICRYPHHAIPTLPVQVLRLIGVALRRFYR